MKNNVRETVIFVVIFMIVSFAIYELSTSYSNKNNKIEKNNDNKIDDKIVIFQSENEIKDDSSIEKKDYKSNKNDQNALSISGNINVKLDNISLTKYGDTYSDNNSNTYGINSGLLVSNVSNLNIINSTINTDATGANGIFADNSKIDLDSTSISTQKNNSSGIISNNESNIIFNSGSIITNGGISPALYSRSNIEVNYSKLISNHSEGLVIEGKNSIVINNSELTSTNDVLFNKASTYHNILIYQPFNSESTNGIAKLVINNSTITTNKGDTLFVTNVDANIELKNSIFNNNDNNGFFIRIQKDNWGIDGLNGGVVNLKLDNQKITGKIAVDEISVLNMTLNNQSYYEGVINGDNNGGKIEIVLDKKSKIKLTGDSYITSINDSNRAYTNIDFNGYKLFVNGNPLN